MPTNSANSKLKQVVAGLTEVMDGVNDLLSEPEHSMLLLGFNADMKRLINRFAFLAGVDVNISSPDDFPPVPESQGPAEITPEDINPDEDAKRVFIAKVEKMESEVDTVDPDVLLKSYPLPEDQVVIRGVAKRAGVHNFEDADINVDLILAIREGRKNQAEDKNRMASIDSGGNIDPDDDLQKQRANLSASEIVSQIKNNQLSSEGGNQDNILTDEDFIDPSEAADILFGHRPPKPLAKWNKTELQTELTKRGIEFDPEATNKVLIDQIEKDDEGKAVINGGSDNQEEQR